MKFSCSVLSYFLATAGVAADETLASTIRNEVGDGGGNTMSFYLSYANNDGSSCAPCALCEGSALHNAFDPNAASLCFSCTDDASCDEAIITNSFDKAFLMTYTSLTSHEGDVSFDPETISIQASADYDEENNTGSWSTLASLSSASVYTTRNESQDILFDNSVLYSHYRFIFRRKDNYSTMKIGHVGVVESYLKKYAVDLFGRIANSDVLGLPTNVPSADPSAGPSSGPTNAPTATPISLEPTESPSISSNPTYPIFPEFINEAAGGPLQVAVDMWRYNRPLALQTYGDIKYWRTGRVVWMKNLFYYKEGFNEDISLWDTSNVTTMSNMFNHAYVFNANLNMWNTGKVKTMEAMFHATQRFNSDIGNWDTSQVTTFQSMFNAAAVFNKDISTWDTGEAEKLIHMFSETNHFNIDVSPWNISKVTNMHRMFRSAIGFNQDICWDTSGKVVTEVFSYCPGGSFCV